MGVVGVRGVVEAQQDAVGHPDTGGVLHITRRNGTFRAELGVGGGKREEGKTCLASCHLG